MAADVDGIAAKNGENHMRQEGDIMSKKPNAFHIFMWSAAIGSALLLAIFLLLYFSTDVSVFLTLSITFGTICYHFSVRLLIGGLLYHRCVNPEHFWFRSKKWEQAIFRLLKIRRWKLSVPTYNPDEFSLAKRTPAEIIRTMCVSELVHECNVVFSFVPLLAVPVFGTFWLFFLTSLAAACYDMLFVLLQRYNRPRMQRMQSVMERKKSKISEKM